MRIAYQIGLHNKEWQFQWLFDALYNSDDLFAIHVDSKAADSTMDAVYKVAGNKPNVHFQERRSVIYGDWQLCQVELDGIKHFLTNRHTWDFFINLSGQDYPLKPRQKIVDELGENRESNFINMIHLDTLPAYFRRRIRWFCFRVGDRFIRTPVPWRKPSHIKLHWHGSAWHILSRDFCEWVVSDRLAQECMLFLKHVKLSNEFLMQTLIMNSPFIYTLVPSYRRKMFWRYHSPHPETLTMKHLPALVNSDAMFARKFDAHVDKQILHALAERNGFRTSR